SRGCRDAVDRQSRKSQVCACRRQERRALYWFYCTPISELPIPRGRDDKRDRSHALRGQLRLVRKRSSIQFVRPSAKPPPALASRDGGNGMQLPPPARGFSH